MTPEVIFVTMVLPALVVAGAWVAIRIHRWDLKRTYGH